MIRAIKNFAHLVNAFLACMYYSFPGKHLTVIGITGTDGKTTTTHLTYEVLRAAGRKVSMVSSVYGLIAGREHDTGFHVTTPNPWFLQKSLRSALSHGDNYFVLEVTSHGLDQNRVWGIPFAIGILTNVTHEHLDYHGNYKKYVSAKSKLLMWSKIAIVNCEDDSYKHISQNDAILAKSKTYGLKKGDITLKSFSFKTSLPGTYNQLNCLAAATAAKELGISDEDIKAGLAAFSGVKGRFETIKTKFGFDVIIDFAHTPNSLVRVLSTIRGMAKGRIIHVFGCAGLRDFTKRPMMGAASADYADITIITEEDTRTENIETIMSQIEEGYNRELPELESNRARTLFKINERQEAIDKAISLAKKGDIVVLTGKGHEKSLCRGKTEYPWSDHEGTERALKQLK